MLNDAIEENDLSTSVAQVTLTIWEKFDEQVSSVVDQNNRSVASILELDKYLGENLLNKHLDSLKW